MKKHIKGIKISVIFLICFFGLFSNVSYSATWPGLYYQGEDGLCFEVGLSLVWSDPSYWSYVPQITLHHPAIWEGVQVNQSSASPVNKVYFYQRPSGDTSNPAWQFQYIIKSINGYVSDATALLTNSGATSTPDCAPVPTCDAIDVANAIAACPLQAGSFVCEGDILVGQCTIKRCSDITDSILDQFCPSNGVPTYRNLNCTDTLNAGLIVPYPYDISVDCSPCADLRATWGDANCVGGERFIASYDCNTNTGTCRTANCGELSNDCSEKCWGLVETFTCSDSSGTATITVPCTCKDGVITPDPPAPPDTIDNHSTLPDPSDLDNTLLKKIVSNTYSISKITDKRLHDIEITLQKSSDRASQDSQSLGQRISDVYNSITGGKTSDGKKHYDLGYQLNDIIEFFTDSYTPPTDAHSTVPDFVDGNFTQPSDTDLQSILESQTTQIDTTALFTPNLTTSLVDPILRGDILGGTVEIDFSQYETLFKWAGNLLYFLCSIQALFIAFRK